MQSRIVEMSLLLGDIMRVGSSTRHSVAISIERRECRRVVGWVDSEALVTELLAAYSKANVVFEFITSSGNPGH